MDFASSTRAAENRTRWKGIVASSSVVPRRRCENQYYIFQSKDRVFFLPKQSQKSGSILQDGSRSSGLFWKGKTCIIAKFYNTDLVI